MWLVIAVSESFLNVRSDSTVLLTLQHQSSISAAVCESLQDSVIKCVCTCACVCVRGCVCEYMCEGTRVCFPCVRGHSLTFQHFPYVALALHWPA